MVRSNDYLKIRSGNDHPHPILHNRAESNTDGAAVTGLCWTRQIIPYRNGAIWIMVGRTRKIGRRQPNGQLARAYQNPKAQVASQPHRVVVPMKFREMPEAESEFGRLMLNGWVTPAQYEAGKMYAELAARYRSALMAPSPNPSGINLGGVGGGKSHGMADGTARSIKRAYDSAFESCGPVRLQKLIAHHVIHDRRCFDLAERELLKTGLSKLVVRFGIDPRLQISESRT